MTKTEDLNFIYPETMYLVIKREYIQSEKDENEYTISFSKLGLFLTKEEARKFIDTIQEGRFNARCVEVSFKEMDRIYNKKSVNVYK